MMRPLALLLFATAPALAEQDAQPALVTLGLEAAQERSERLLEVVAPNGIATSQMTSDGTVPVTVADGSIRSVRLDFIGAYENDACIWAADFSPLPNLSRDISRAYQARLIAEGYPDQLTSTVTTFSIEECRVRSLSAAANDDCLTVLPVTLTDTLELHFGIRLPELCS